MDSERSAKPAPSEDVLLIHGVTEDGNGLEVLRRRDDRLESGLVRPLEPNRPIHGEVVRLRPRPDLPLVCDVTVEHAPPRPATDVARPTSKGPAQVATTTYRDNWDRIWSARSLPN